MVRQEQADRAPKVGRSYADIRPIVRQYAGQDASTVRKAVTGTYPLQVHIFAGTYPSLVRILAGTYPSRVHILAPSIPNSICANFYTFE